VSAQNAKLFLSEPLIVIHRTSHVEVDPSIFTSQGDSQLLLGSDECNDYVPLFLVTVHRDDNFTIDSEMVSDELLVNAYVFPYNFQRARKDMNYL